MTSDPKAIYAFHLEDAVERGYVECLVRACIDKRQDAKQIKEAVQADAHTRHMNITDVLFREAPNNFIDVSIKRPRWAGGDFYFFVRIA